MGSAPSDSFDLVVIGCGPAGEKAGAQAAYFGKRVAVIERAPVPGGSCVNTTKLFANRPSIFLASRSAASTVLTTL